MILINANIEKNIPAGLMFGILKNPIYIGSRNKHLEIWKVTTSNNS